MKKRDWLVWVGLLGIIVLAAFFRFNDIQNYPAGLFPDEAANGEDALLVLDGDYRAFYPRGNGREGLFYYLLAGSISLFGIGVWQVHVVSAAIGVLTVIAAYFATRPWFGKLAGLMAAGLLATNHWHVTMSRTGFRAILIPLMVAGFTAAAGYTMMSVRDGKKGKAYFFAALAGAFFAGGFYTYIAYRVMIGVILGMAIVWLLASLHPKIGWPHLYKYWKHMLVGAAAAFIVFLPLGIFFAQNPSAIVGRAGQVSVFNKEIQQPGGVLPTIVWSFNETIKSFLAGEGDLNWRHNVAGYPLLNPLVAVLYLLGLAWAIHGFIMLIYKIIRGQELHLGLMFPYLLLMIAGMLMPVITTAEGIPHGLRSIGLVLPMFMLAGVAGAVLLHYIRRRSNVFSRGLGLGVIIGLLVLGIGYDYLLYFVVARNDSEARYAYRSDLTVVSDWLNEYGNQYPDLAIPYLVLDKFSVQTVHFLTSVDAHDFQSHPDENNHRYRLLDPAKSHETALRPGEVIIFNASTLPDAERYEMTYGNTGLEVVKEVRNRYDEVEMLIYGLPVTDDETPALPIDEEIPAGLDA